MIPQGNGLRFPPCWGCCLYPVVQPSRLGEGSTFTAGLSPLLCQKSPESNRKVQTVPVPFTSARAVAAPGLPRWPEGSSVPGTCADTTTAIPEHPETLWHSHLLFRLPVCFFFFFLRLRPSPRIYVKVKGMFLLVRGCPGPFVGWCCHLGWERAGPPLQTAATFSKYFPRCFPQCLLLRCCPGRVYGQPEHSPWRLLGQSSAWRLGVHPVRSYSMLLQGKRCMCNHRRALYCGLGVSVVLGRWGCCSLALLWALCLGWLRVPCPHRGQPWSQGNLLHVAGHVSMFVFFTSQIGFVEEVRDLWQWPQVSAEQPLLMVCALLLWNTTEQLQGWACAPYCVLCFAFTLSSPFL